MLERIQGNGRYHNAIRMGSLLFLSGQTATERGEGIEAQSEGTLEAVEELLLRNGSDKDHILHADVYIRDRKDVPAFNKVWDQWVNKETAPTRACMVSELGRHDILVEVVVTAAVKGS